MLLFSVGITSHRNVILSTNYLYNFLAKCHRKGPSLTGLVQPLYHVLLYKGYRCTKAALGFSIEENDVGKAECWRHEDHDQLNRLSSIPWDWCETSSAGGRQVSEPVVLAPPPPKCAKITQICHKPNWLRRLEAHPGSLESRELFWCWHHRCGGGRQTAPSCLMLSVNTT